MLPVELVFSALFGLVFGSFLNVCIVRLPRGESIMRPRSRCFACGVTLRTIDNMPVFSWLFLRGHSHCCGQRIPFRYPIVEAATACLFIGSVLRFGTGVPGLGMAVLCWLLLGLAWMDAETYLLPDAFTLTGVALGVAYQGLVSIPAGTAMLHSLLAAAAMGSLLWAIALVYRLLRRREGMGMGDVKLGAMLGAWLGWQFAGVALFLAVVTGAAAGMGWVLVRAAVAKEEAQPADEPLRLPFGTFLASAGIATVFAGDWLLAWYMHFFR